MRRIILLAVALVIFVSAGSVSAAAIPLPHMVMSILGSIGPQCSPAIEFQMSNVGDGEQPFGWTLTLSIKDLGTSQTFTGEQPLAPGASLQSLIGTGITAPGAYHVTLQAGGVLGPKTDTLDRALVLV